MGDSQLEPSSIVVDAIRKILSFFDRAAFWLLGLVYELFFNVASADLFANSSLMKFYGRMQLILGVFMMFQLALTILKGIVNPDTITDSKSGGAMQFVYRIAVSLVLLTLLVPFETGRSNEFEKQISNNGLLFGTLYSLQNRILANNTIGRLVLGTNETNYFSTDLSAGRETLRTSARVFTSTILKGFYRINLLPESSRPKHEDGKDDAIFNDNRVCQDFDDAMLNAYTRVDADPGEIISMVNETCSNSSIQGKKSLLTIFRGNKYYRFAYNGFISMIVGFVFVVIMFSFTIEVAVRSVKLAVLRIIAPVPIISYMDPKGSKDNAFNTWVKTLSSTYLDLFIRLATIYFVLFIIQSMITNGVVINYGTGVIGVISVIIIWIGLFAFAKQAPKFIRAIFGLKDEGPGLLSGFKEFGNAMGLAAAIPGAIGSAAAGYRASLMADRTRQSFGETSIFGTPVNPNSLLNRGKHILAGFAGALAGGAAGVNGALTAKEHGFHSSMEAMRKRNADVLARGNSGSTLLGRVGSDVSSLFWGEGTGGQISRDIESNKGRIKALEAVKKRVTGEMIKMDWTRGALGIQYDNAGNVIGDVNFKHFDAELEASKSRGDGLVNFTDTAGVAHTVSYTDAVRQRGFLLKNNEDDYLTQHTDPAHRRGDTVVDQRLVTLINDANVLGGGSGFTRHPDGRIEKGGDHNITNRSFLNDSIDGFEDYNTYLGRQNAINEANDMYSANKNKK